MLFKMWGMFPVFNNAGCISSLDWNLCPYFAILFSMCNKKFAYKDNMQIFFLKTSTHPYWHYISAKTVHIYSLKSNFAILETHCKFKMVRLNAPNSEEWTLIYLFLHIFKVCFVYTGRFQWYTFEKFWYNQIQEWDTLIRLFQKEKLWAVLFWGLFELYPALSSMYLKYIYITNTVCFYK